ncbi:hydrogenase small subunit [Candidatus Nomurabacteria bacterium]|nr:hydrogenase small subunit [Candidatus Nomurabacteria bacterium]
MERDLSRREFVKYCSVIAASLGFPLSWGAKIAHAIEKASKRPRVIWLHFAECTGDTESFLRAYRPSIAEIVLDIISLDYHETIMAPSGHSAHLSLKECIEQNRGQYLVIAEGAIPTKDNGVYLTIGNQTGLEIAKEVCSQAFAVLCVGTCSSFGGVQAMGPNPTQAKGVQEATGLPIEKFIYLPGCPHNVQNSVATIVHYLLFNKLPPLDHERRPLFAYGKKIHDHCPRRKHFEAGEFVEHFGDEGDRKKWCLYRMGCKGPSTFHNCPQVLWNDGTSWPVEAGHGCNGCSERNFWDSMSPFYERLPEHTPFGEVSANTMATVLGVATGVGIAAHSAISYAKGKVK